MKISWIEPKRIAASGIPIDAKDIRSLHQQGIRAIISLTERPLWSQREITPTLLAALDIVYYHAPVPDHHPPSFEQANQFRVLFDQLASQQRATCSLPRWYWADGHNTSSILFVAR